MRGENSGFSTVTSAIIIGAMTLAIGIIILVIYNVISSELEYSTESNLTLEIQKDSVLIAEDGKVSLKVSRDLGDSELEKIRFVFSDGENIEEIERDAKDFEQSSEKDFNFNPRLVKNIRTISLVPIIKINDQRKFLSVQDSVQINKNGGKISTEKVTFICGNGKLEVGEQCDDGNLVSGDGCSMTCKTEAVSTQTTTSVPVPTETAPTAVCGDKICNTGESASSCASDCGEYSWISSNWSACSVECGGGTQTRTVTCKRNDNQTVVDSSCAPPKPGTSQACNEQACAKSNGQSCSVGSDCSSGICTDGVCCNSACSGTCQACNIAGSLGTCSNVALGQDPASECSSTTCTDYISGWSGSSCVKYASATANNGMCNGAGACTNVIQSCTGTGTTSASCGSSGCKANCPAGELATSYDSVGEICYTSGANSCSTGQFCDSSGACYAPTPTSCGSFQNRYNCNTGTYVGQKSPRKGTLAECQSYCGSVGATCCYYGSDDISYTTQGGPYNSDNDNFCNAYMGTPQYFDYFSNNAASCS